MKARVVAVGDETALVLPNEVAKMLDLKPGREVFVRRLPDGGYRIGSNDPTFEEGMRIAEEVMVEYAETFKALAKS